MGDRSNIPLFSLSPAEGERVGPLARSSRRLGEVRGKLRPSDIFSRHPSPWPSPFRLAALSRRRSGRGEGKPLRALVMHSMVSSVSAVSA